MLNTIKPSLFLLIFFLFFRMSEKPLILLGKFTQENVTSIGSNKSPYDFLKSALLNSNATEEHEKFFKASFEGYTFKHFQKEDFEVFILSYKNQLKAYIVSDYMPFAVDIDIDDIKPMDTLNIILNDMKITRRDK